MDSVSDDHQYYVHGNPSHDGLDFSTKPVGWSLWSHSDDPVDDHRPSLSATTPEVPEDSVVDRLS